MVCCYESLLKDHLLPDWGFEWPGLAVSTTGVYSLSTFALSLLLVFRTNSSYQRCVSVLRRGRTQAFMCGAQAVQFSTILEDAQKHV
jgi:hypothetical protein